MNREELKQAVCAEIDRRRDDIIGIADTMLHHPELGYKEIKTAALVRNTLAGLGLPVREGLAITGVDGVLAGDKPGPSLCIMGELDSVMAATPAVCDPVTGAAHQCGHHIQVASMLGAAIGLVGAGAAGALAGKIHFLGAPAEEFLEIEYRLGLANAGKITYLGGKQELIKLGYFDEIDIAMMVHAASKAPEPGLHYGFQANGFLAKFIRYAGRASHAGAAPQDGINALNAACLGILAVHAQRETFQDQDSIRVHPDHHQGRRRGERRALRRPHRDLRARPCSRSHSRRVEEGGPRVPSRRRRGRRGDAHPERARLPAHLPGRAADRASPWRTAGRCWARRAYTTAGSWAARSMWATCRI